jgi:D-glycero-alpha-D-manno-heptose-7-phosphate kinase
MIISKTPSRVSFIGGGTDIKDFYLREQGNVLSTSINKYVYLLVKPSFGDTILLRYSKSEDVNDIKEIKNGRIRECMKKTGIEKGVEIGCFSDIPIGAGLGGSSSFTVGLLNALYAYKGEFVGPERLAKEACEIEIDVLGEPIGKQDQYAAAYGGLNNIQFNVDDSVKIRRIFLERDKRNVLEKKLLLFCTGETRSSSEILFDQKKEMINKDKFDSMKKMSSLALDAYSELSKGNIDCLGNLLKDNWELKRTLSEKISNEKIEILCENAFTAGAKGGKILGAGGGGFLLFYCDERIQDNVKKVLDLHYEPFKLEPEGSKIIYCDQ